MAQNNNLEYFMVMLTLFYLSLNIGCTQSRARVPVNSQHGQVLTCEDVQTSGVHGLSDRETALLLDQALESDRLADCWIPVMERCLNEDKDIPHEHLAKAIHVFNKRQYQDLFNKAVFRYFSSLANGEDSYGSEDQLLMETFCSYLINNATTRQDQNLKQASLLCHRLDPDLYGRLFR